jgi:Flp pilus assembly protein TadG
MKDGSKIRFNNRGVAIVLLALGVLLVVLIFASLAIDIAYMYNVKNQLQVAADASALAGAKRLVVASDSDPSAFTQTFAREEAWKFACKNTAAGTKVYVQTDTKQGDCDNPPNSGLNESNSDGGDIVVGNWDPKTSTFKAATGGTGLQINAVRIVARRTAGSPGGPVKVFWGQVLRLIASDWSRMSAASQAIAVQQGPGKGPFPICSLDCGRHTPLVTPVGTPPGVRFSLQNPTNPPPPPYIGWTTFYDNNTSTSNVSAYVLGQKEAPSNICGTCVMTNEGLLNPAICAVRQRILGSGADYTLTADGNTYTVHGWEILVPILPQDSTCPGGKNGCIGNPGAQPGDPYPVIQYALAIITDASPQGVGTCSGPWPYPVGTPGIVMVGTGPGGTESDGTPYSTIQCLPCDDPTFANLSSVKLVK